MGMAEAALLLFARHLKYDAAAPSWPDRDRFILSNGHGSMLQYALLYLTGYKKIDLAQLRRYRQLGSRTPGHPEYDLSSGIEATTGPLGQGIAMGVGMALAEARLAAEFSSALVNHRTWIFAGDGCLMEGIGQEAMSLAGHLALGKLIVVFDDNGITIDGATSLARSEDVCAKVAACGWQVSRVDGYDLAAIDAAYAQARQKASQPHMIALRTEIGRGAPSKAGTAAVHGAPLGAVELAAARKRANWSQPPFVVPPKLLAKWRSFGVRGRALRMRWEARLSAAPTKVKAELKRRLRHALPASLTRSAAAFRRRIAATPAGTATRKSSLAALDFYAAQMPELIGGSADLTGSNLTKAVTMTAYTPAKPNRYIHFGVREFAMAAAVNGMFLHGGLRPYGGTFLVFSDYMRNALRLAALMRIGSIFVLTHDSIGLGEDGPTHQPIEHLASLRAMPNIFVFRPADAVETAECWELALRSKSTPSVLALSRQGLAQIRSEGGPNLCARGAYILESCSDRRDVSILATGSEVELALAAARALAKEDIHAVVVSMPCWELFAQQPASYRAAVLGTAPRIAVEAGSKFGWASFVPNEDNIIAMTGFGESAPAKQLYQHCGITSAAVADRARQAVRPA